MKIRGLAVNYFLIAAAAVMLTIIPAAGALGKPVFDLVSLANDGSLPQNFYNGDRSRITPDGRFVVFRSGETQLVAPQTSGNQIFVRDRQQGTTQLISMSDAGAYGNDSSDWATISNDGCRVVFQSYSSNLVADDTNGLPDVFLRDRCITPMRTTRINLNYSGAQSMAASYTPYLSGNGRYIAFNSYSTDLVAGVTRADLLYLRDLELQTTILLSESIVDGLGEQAWNPAVSDDGSRVAFTAASTKLFNGVVAGWNVFLYDANTVPHIRLVSSDANGAPQDTFANGDQPHPGISADGHSVSFYSNSRNLVPDDTNNFTDVFVKNVDTNEIWRANVSSTGIQADGDTRFDSTLSQDGTWVTFWASASNLIASTSISRFIVMHNIHTGETRRVLGADPEYFPAISGDLYGRFISSFWAEKLDDRYNSVGVFVYDRHNLPVAIAKVDTSITLPAQQGNTITLDGSSSHNNENTGFFAPKATPSLVYTWTQTDGNSVSFSDSHAAKPSFTAPADGAYTFRLVVSDTVEDSAPNTVSILVGPGTASLSVAQGWNLLGNSLNQAFPVGSVYGDPAVVTTVWKWDVNTPGWQFYTPQMDAPTLQAYASSKGYSVLSVINPGEGHWVNAKAAASLGPQAGLPFALTSANLVSGWNLVATGNNVTPPVFNLSLSAASINLTTLWAWDNPQSKWYFYAPSLEANGGLANYVASKGYLDFAQYGKTLGNGAGFWVNRP